jgi:hypothetical protein
VSSLFIEGLRPPFDFDKVSARETWFRLRLGFCFAVYPLLVFVIFQELCLNAKKCCQYQNYQTYFYSERVGDL